MPQEAEVIEQRVESEKSWVASMRESMVDPDAAPPEPAPAPEPAPTPGAPAPTPAPAPKTEEALDPAKWPRTAKDWKRWNEARDKERETWKAERETLSKQVEEAKKAAPATMTEADKGALEALKKERDTMSERLRLLDIQQHPEFQQKFSAALTEQLSLAKRIVPTAEVENVEKALKLPDGEAKNEALEDVMDRLTPLQQSRLGSVLNNISTIESQRQSEIERAAKDWDNIVAQGNERQKQTVTQREKMFDTLVQQLQDAKEGSPIYQLKDKDDAWNDTVKQRVEGAKALLFGNKATPEQVIKAALHAQAYPVLLQFARSLQDDKLKLEKQVQDLTAAGPRIPAAGGKGGDEGGYVLPKPGSDPHAAAIGFMKGLHQAANQQQ